MNVSFWSRTRWHYFNFPSPWVACWTAFERSSTRAVNLAINSGLEVKQTTFQNLASADALFAEGDFKGAYETYAKAYRSVIK